TELGTDHVQGTDYAYTLQGWMKGVNGFANTTQNDIGQDANPSSSGSIGYQGQHKNTAQDVYSYWLGYYQGDYQPIANSNANVANTIAPLTTGIYQTAPAPLYNGNIQSISI
ncbi:MAG: hypothetical protein KBG11_07320, partial [Bacteroidia bacterium]|nr:hypothetical protein [Bacteroidia bacterium]